ncbi:ribosome-inactivating family protein [Nonomuraea sp. MG754425]|uniref:ribosome-inactivating family protein n=1 Tax=Nonomuraea sp. MG754425 TaxID=2570319 RepID=UPI001F25532D|nr:ribosome-inactivating family protein [Nonomuraea sp. MG754425]
MERADEATPQESDTLTFGYDNVTTREDFLAVVQFLRNGFNSYADGAADGNFMHANFLLQDGATSVQLYFQKKDLYLVGWAIDGGLGDYIGAGDEARPAGAVKMNPGSDMPVAYTVGSADSVLLSRKIMEDALAALYNYAQNYRFYLDRGRTGPPPKPGNATESFQLIIRMTAEMARFGAYCDHFATDHWERGWDQLTGIQVGSERFPPFRTVINMWGDVTKTAKGLQNSVTYLGEDRTSKTITTAQAITILGQGAQMRLPADPPQTGTRRRR